MRVKCVDVSVEFPANGHEVRALDDLSFETRNGEFLTIVGPSGCGKTTLLRTIAGLIPPSRGAVGLSPSSSDGRSRVLLVFQENNLFPWMSVVDNAAFGMEMQGVERKVRERRALEMLRRFGLGGRERDYPHQLSLGMKQRVAVIRSFLSDPAVLLMDEPFAALDAQTRLTLQQELIALWEEEDHRSVIFVTHDVEEAILLSDRILVLSRLPGRVMAEFQVPFARPRHVSVTLDEEFLALKREVWSRLGLKVESKVTAEAARW